MHIFQTVFFGLLALVWAAIAIYVRRGMSHIPHIANVAPLTSEPLPKVSILFAARDEAEKLPAALASLAALDYTDYEVIAVDDRSQDATGQILDDFARHHPRLKIVHITDLPEGWLGKPHALQKGCDHASGEWLLFTDADVRLSPDVLRNALGLAKQKGWDYLTLTAGLEVRGFWEAAAVGYFGTLFVFGIRPWLASDPKSGTYMGVGAFQLVSRNAYAASGGHRRLAMEVVDDMKLAKLVKRAGFTIGVGGSDDKVQVRWHDGLWNIVRGVTKNFFAGFNFRVSDALKAIAAIFIISILPAIELIVGHGSARIAAGIAVVIPMVLTGRLLRETRCSQLYGITHPIGAAITIFMILRSMLLTLWQGGIVWRGTFYPLDELKRGLV